MNIFQIKNNQILCNSWDFKDEVDMVNQARDEVSKEFQKDLLEGKSVIFEDWDYKTGTIDFKIDYL